MENDQLAITSRDYILLEEVRAHRVRHGLSGQRMLGQIG